MSEKNAKKQRKIDTNQVVARITITAQASGTLNIEGIPTEPLMAMDIIGKTLSAMAQKIHEAQEAAKSGVIPVKSSIVGPDGRRLH